MRVIKGAELFRLIVERLRRKHGYKYALTEAVVQEVLWGLREVAIDELRFRKASVEDCGKRVVEVPGIVRISGYDGVINLYLDACDSFLKRVKRSDKRHSAYFKRLLMEVHG